MIGMGMMGKSWFTLLPLLPPERTQIKRRTQKIASPESAFICGCWKAELYPLRAARTRAMRSTPSFRFSRLVA